MSIWMFILPCLLQEPLTRAMIFQPWSLPGYQIWCLGANQGCTVVFLVMLEELQEKPVCLRAGNAKAACAGMRKRVGA